MNIDVHQLIKRYGPAFDMEIGEYHVLEGDAIGLVGNNGAGKSTFLRLVLDLAKANRGYVLINGRNVADSITWKAFTGSYLDESFLIDYLTPDEYLAFVGQVYGYERAQLHAALDPFRSFYTDEPLGQTTKYLRELSKGNMKKVGLIAAMFIRPKLLILDEPFANLDPRSQIQLKQLLGDLNTDGSTLIVSSHDLLHVTDICNRITIMKSGRIVKDIHATEMSYRELEQFFQDDLMVEEPKAPATYQPA
ncbi:MAG: ABC transporter ATP-binding protein [Bacteroidota bacterium]